MSRSFYASRLSDNIAKTPEGYLVCRDSVIARTGKQQYRVSEITRGLDSEIIKDLGLDSLKPSESVNLFRDPDEVLDKSALASFEGKPVTDGHPKDPDGVHADNIREYQCGHVQNVREMPGALDSGENAILADVIVTDARLAERVEAGTVRELSCGYTYDLKRDGERLLQTRIRGNHVAIVPSGRAGSEVRIQDAAEPVTAAELPKAVSPKADSPVQNSQVRDSPKADSSKPDSPTQEEEKMTNEFLTKLLSTMEQIKDGLTSRRAADAKDSDGEAAKEKAEEKAEEKGADAEGDKPEQLKDAKAKDGKGKDAGKDGGSKKGYDTKHGEMGDKMHAALDRILDEMKQEEQATAGDADLEELRKLLSQFFEEEEEEPEHEGGEGGDGEGEEEAEAEHEIEHTHESDAGEEEGAEESSEFESPDDDENDDDEDDHGGEESPEEGSEKNSADANRWPDRSRGDKRSKASGYAKHSRSKDDDRAYKAAASYKAGAIDALEDIRPAIARHGSEKVKKAFRAAMDRLNGTSRSGEGNYARFADASARRGRDAAESKQQYYDRLNKEAKEALMNPGRKKA